MFGNKFVASLVRDILSNAGAINYYTNRNLERIKMPANVYDKYFKGKNWDTLEKEQLIFINDVLYFCIY